MSLDVFHYSEDQFDQNSHKNAVLTRLKSQLRLVCLSLPAFGKRFKPSQHFEMQVCGSVPRLRSCFAATATHRREHSISSALLAAIYS